MQRGAITHRCRHRGVVTRPGGLTAPREEIGSDGSRAESGGGGAARGLHPSSGPVSDAQRGGQAKRASSQTVRTIPPCLQRSSRFRERCWLRALRNLTSFSHKRRRRLLFCPQHLKLFLKYLSSIVLIIKLCFETSPQNSTTVNPLNNKGHGERGGAPDCATSSPPTH